MACVGCGEQVSLGARFCSICGQNVVQVASPMAPPAVRQRQPFPAVAGLYRPRERRMIAGVCAGFALRYGWDVTIVRLVLVLSVLLGLGVPIIGYLIAWVVMPCGQYALPAQASYGATDSMKM